MLHLPTEERALTMPWPHFGITVDADSGVSREFYDYSGFVVEPHAVQKRVPLWIGGRTKRSLRRATTHGDGWVPFGLRFSELKEMLDATTLPDGFDVVLPAGAPLDPLGNRESTSRLDSRP